MISDTKINYEYAEKMRAVADYLLSEPGWKMEIPPDNQDAAYLESKQTKKFVLPYYRIHIIINLPKETLVNIIWKATKFSALIDDPTITSLETLEETRMYKIRRQVNEMGFLCWPRETVFIQHRFDIDDVTWLVGYSVNHPYAPLREHMYVRATLNLSVYKYTALAQNKTLVQRIVNINPNGHIPVAIIKSYSGKLINAFNRWQRLKK
jgi:hypothetical protein